MAQTGPGDFRPGVATVPATKVEISVSCRNLKDRDTFSKSDPMCVLNIRDLASENFREVGRTEMIKDTLNPDFVKKFVMDYMFEESQKLKFELYDVDSPSARLDHHDFLGRLECTLGEIVGASGNNLTKPLSGLTGKNGNITVRAEEVGNCKELVTFKFSGKKLDKKDFLGKSDPFLVLYRSNADGSFTVVHKTEVIKNNLNPTWRHFGLKVQSLCGGDHSRQIKFECYDWDSDGGHDFIGAFTASLQELKDSATSGREYELINPKKKAKKKSYKDSGKINVASCKIEQEYSFLDFVQGGTEINFTVAIDFTASNGNPSNPTSLHYLNPYQPNLYTRALQAVGEIVQDYDTDKQFPALGFGARVPPSGQVSHEFFLNFNPSNPYCQGLQGLLAAYHKAIQCVQLYGPTNFAPVINHVAQFATAYREGTHYFILLILTDGVITDMPNTKQAIIKASALPMSIIIIGIGDADFDAMEELDADNKRLCAFGQYAERDIVQFVPFRDFFGGRYGNNPQTSQAYLAKEVLAEIPDQVTGYMKTHGIKPRPPSARPVPGPGQSVGAAPGAAGAPPPASTAPPAQAQAAHRPPPPRPAGPPAPPPSYPPAGGHPGGPPPPAYAGAGAGAGAAPYPGAGAAPYSGAGAAPYPGAGAAPYPSAGQGPMAMPSLPKRGSAPPQPGQPQGGYPGQPHGGYP